MLYKKFGHIALVLALCTHVILLAHDRALSLDQWLDQAKQTIQKKILPNGMTVLFYHLPTTAQVDVRVTVNVGSRDEREGQYGLAHMVEHMIFKGTAKMSEVDLKLIAEKYGNAYSNAYTSNDQTSYFFVTDNKHWPLFLSILADSMTNTRFDENHFNSEVKAVISELNMNRAKAIRKATGIAFESTFPLNHPYHHLPIGCREDLMNATAHDLKKFYQQHYTPDRTTVTIVGNLDRQEVFDNTEKLFGAIKSQQHKSQKKYTPEAFLPTDFVQRNTTIHTQTTKPQVYLYWQVPGLKNKEHLVSACIAYVLNERLKKLKDTHDLIFSFQSGYCGMFEAGLFFIVYEPKVDELSKTLPEIHVDQQCQILIENEIHDLTNNGPTKKELNRFKVIERNDFINAFEDATSIAYVLGACCLNGNEFEAFENFDFTQNITVHDIKNFSKKYFGSTITNRVSCVPLQEKEKIDWVQLQKEIDTYEQQLLATKQRNNTIELPRLLNQLPEPRTLDFNFDSPDFEGMLSNGLKIYIKQRVHMPTISMLCGFKNSQAIALYHEMQEMGHVPMLAMDLLIEESKEYTKKEHAHFFDSLGADYSFSHYGGFLSCIATDFDAGARRFFYILQNPIFPEKSFIQRIDNAQKHIIMNQDDENHRAKKALSGHLYQAYPWTYTDSQLLEQLQSYTRQDLITFHETFIRPEKMALVIVGNVNPIELFVTLETMLSSWAPSTNTLPRTQIPDLAHPPAKTLKIPLPKEQVVLLAGRTTTTKDTRDAHALELLETYLNRKLYNIRENTGLFYFCNASLQPDSRITKGHAVIKTQVAPQNLAKAKDEIKQVLQELATYGVSQEYVTMAKQNYQAHLATAFSTNKELLFGYYSLVNNDKSFDHYYTELAKINALTLEEINAVAQTYLNPDAWTFVEVGRVTP